MEHHTEWQALQTHLRCARASFETGDRISALEEIDAVLRIDPSFLAAHSLRDRILNPPDSTTGSIPVGLSDEFEVSRDDADERRHPAIDFSESEMAGATTDQSDPFQGLGISWVREPAVEEPPAPRSTRGLSAEKDDLLIDFERRVPQTPALVGRGAAAAHPDRGPLAHGLRLGSFIALVALALFFAWNSGLRIPTRTGPAQVASRPSGQPSDEMPGKEVLAESTVGRQNAADAVAPAAPPLDAPQSDVSGSTPPVPPAALAAVSVPAERDVRSASSSSLLSGAPSAPLVVSSPADAGADTDVAADDRVRDALQQFRRGFESLDVLAVRDAWPTVNVDELARTFRGLESQQVTFDDCSVRRSADAASAACRSRVEYVPKGGLHSAHVEARVWTFNLHNVSDSWKIDTARFTAFSETERVSRR